MESTSCSGKEDEDKRLCVWSFTSDGKRSTGQLVEATDIHPSALAFESNMPAGIARQVYWPDAEEGFHWVVESRTKKGWNRFVEHHTYQRGLSNLIGGFADRITQTPSIHST